MILAEKIINERKKNGWSQEELADKLGVSRQSVSKWESAQSVPDLQRILDMSRLFGVSTDYLLKDEIENVTPSETVDTGSSLRIVSMEESNAYLDTVKVNSKKIALGCTLCVSSAVPLLLLEAAYQIYYEYISQTFAEALGTILLLLIVAVSLIFLIPAGMALSKWDWLEKEAFETEYGVAGAVRAKAEAYEPRFIRLITTGVVTILTGVIIIVGCAFWAESNPPEIDYASGAFMTESPNQALIYAAAALLLILISVGVNIIIRAGMTKDSYSKILQEGDYSKVKKENKVMRAIAPAYWLLVTAGYLAWSFISRNWGLTWIVWPVAGIIFGAITAVADQVIKD